MTKKIESYSIPLYSELLKVPHLLIAGTTGSGKSVLINGIIHEIMNSSPSQKRLILIDPKKVELYQYSWLPHCLAYTDENAERVLQAAIDLMMNRFERMRRRGLKKSDEPDIYIIIDELADLMLTATAKRRIAPKLQRIAQIGRAAGVHLIAATQCPICEVIPTQIKVNFDNRIGLRTRNAQDSRNIIDCNGCEELPRYGAGLYHSPDGIEKITIPMIPDDDINKMIKFWS